VPIVAVTSTTDTINAILHGACIAHSR